MGSIDVPLAARRRGRFARLVVVVATALLMGVTACSDGAGASVALVASDDAGRDPFTDSMTVRVVTDFPTEVTAVAVDVRDELSKNGADGTLVADGTEPGLYGGSNQAAVCDANGLVTFLAENPDKAEAWASVFDIEPDGIAGYVAGLTPLILLSDTLVLNHGYRDGNATELLSVLEAGTAVMVDSRGVPRVKCGCGNPLAPAPSQTLADVDEEGDPWDGYDPEQVVAVEPGAPAEVLDVVDIDTGEPIEVPVGTSAAQGWVLAVDNSPAADLTDILVSSDGQTWERRSQIPDVQVTGLATDGSRWVAVGTTPDVLERSAVLTSTDLVEWETVAEPDGRLQGLAYGDGRWVAVGSWGSGQTAGGVQNATPVAYVSDDATTWNDAEVPTFAQGSVHRLSGVAFDGTDFVLGGVDEIYPGATDTVDFTATTYRSRDGAEFEPLTQESPTVGSRRLSMAAGDGHSLLGVQPDTAAVGGPPLGSLTLNLGDTGMEQIAGTPFDDTPADELAFGAGRWLAATNGPTTTDDVFSEPEGPAAIYTSTDAHEWTELPDVGGVVRAAAYGRIGGSDPVEPPPTSTTVPPTTTTTPPPPPTQPPTSNLGDLPTLSETAASGSGCAPGPGPLPDGWWYGQAVTPVSVGSTFAFDLMCYYTGGIAVQLALEDGQELTNDVWLVNDRETTRDVLVAPNAELVCRNLGAQEVACTQSPGTNFGIWVRVEGGQATKVLEQFAP